MIPPSTPKRPFPSTPPRSSPPAALGTPPGTPIGTPARGGGQARSISTRVSTALEKAIPGLDANKLVQSLDRLFGNRGNYTLVGSASMHLHALESTPDSSRALPMPNDIDVVVTDRAIDKLNLATKEQLSDLGLQRDQDLPHVLHMKRPGHDDLKIDVVSGRTSGFKRYVSNPHEIDSVQVGRLDDSLSDYKNRLKDPEFIEQCGGKAEAEKKIKPWLDFFGHSSAQAQPNSADSQLQRRRLLF